MSAGIPDWSSLTHASESLPRLLLKLSPRKLRLFYVACCRRRIELFPDALARMSLVVADMVADRHEPIPHRANARAIVSSDHSIEDLSDELAGMACLPVEDLRRINQTGQPYVMRGLIQLAWLYATHERSHSLGTSTEFFHTMKAEETAQTSLFSCISGRLGEIYIPDLTWLTDTVRGIASQCYDSRDFTGLPILADALEDAGCTDPVLLDHCRTPTFHARGCWAIDAILGKV